MNDELTKVKLTIMMSFDKPNKNGSIFTKEAVENAFCNLHRNLPIVYSDDGTNSKVVGATTGESHIVTCDSENQVYKMTVDGVLFDCKPLIAIKEIDGNEISDCQIVSIGLTT